MSKLSFRARALDANKAMPVFIGDDIPAEMDFISVNRAVMEMPTGMEKDEESEHHLQRALSAQQTYGTSEMLAIPIPDMEEVNERFQRLYGRPKPYKPPKQFIHVQPFGFDQEVPDYDMDSEDEVWLEKQVKLLKMEVDPLKFENMMDRLDKGSGQSVVSLNEAKALLKEDDDLTMAVYDYWLNKRLKLKSPLILQVRSERRDGGLSNNPYVAFRRRTEKMQTRKNRKNDEVSYEKMLMLKKDLNKALVLLEIVKRREKSKKEHLKLTVEIIDKRCQLEDWDGSILAEAEAKKSLLPPTLPPFPPIPALKEWSVKPSFASSAGYLANKDQPRLSTKRREYRKKHKLLINNTNNLTPTPHHTHKEALSSQYKNRNLSSTIASNTTISNNGNNNSSSMFMPYMPGHESMEEDPGALSSSSSSDNHDNDPEGYFTFRRKPGVYYHKFATENFPKRRKLLSNENTTTNWPPSYHPSTYNNFSLSSLPRRNHPNQNCCLGYTRQRIGRGGRVILDRAPSDWDQGLHRLDLSQSCHLDPLLSSYITHIRSNGISHYQLLAAGSALQQSPPTPQQRPGNKSSPTSTPKTSFKHTQSLSTTTMNTNDSIRLHFEQLSSTFNRTDGPVLGGVSTATSGCSIATTTTTSSVDIKNGVVDTNDNKSDNAGNNNNNVRSTNLFEQFWSYSRADVANTQNNHEAKNKEIPDDDNINNNTQNNNKNNKTNNNNDSDSTLLTLDKKTIKNELNDATIANNNNNNNSTNNKITISSAEFALSAFKGIVNNNNNNDGTNNNDNNNNTSDNNGNEEAGRIKSEIKDEVPEIQAEHLVSLITSLPVDKEAKLEDKGTNEDGYEVVINCDEVADVVVAADGGEGEDGAVDGVDQMNESNENDDKKSLGNSNDGQAISSLHSLLYSYHNKLSNGGNEVYGKNFDVLTTKDMKNNNDNIKNKLVNNNILCDNGLSNNQHNKQSLQGLLATSKNDNKQSNEAHNNNLQMLIKLQHQQQNIQNILKTSTTTGRSSTIESLLQQDTTKQNNKNKQAYIQKQQQQQQLTPHKKQQKTTKNIYKGGHQVLLRPSICSSDKSNRETLEVTKKPEEKTKSYPMEVT